MKTLERCPWARDELYWNYHDLEWGVPSFDECHLFEMLLLEGAQAGLSWSTILRKRPTYRAAFDHFDARKIARYDDKRIARLMEDPGIVRNRLKVQSAITNAQAFLHVQKEVGSFAAYIWRFVDGQPKVNSWSEMKSLPARSTESDRMSKDLLKRGFKFVGTTICYAYMQAVGMVNDHLVSCPRWKEVQQARPKAPEMIA